ncbi:MAG TPA: hypothetical protein VNZ61_03560 [Roseomonas sp.]|nr:hypothetical protein [Roseomonas sp.]
MPLAGTGIIAIWNDILPEKREVFFEWHAREHMPERIGIPGFRRGRRYAAIEADIEFLTLYEAASIETFSSDGYKARLGQPTPWSLEVLPAFRNNLRGICRVPFTVGHTDGGYAWTLRLDPAEGRAEALKQSLAEILLPPLIEHPKVTGVHFFVCDHSLSGTNTALQRGRTITPPNLVVMIEGSTGDGVRAAAAALTDDVLARHGAAEGARRGLYQLEYGLARIGDHAGT